MPIPIIFILFVIFILIFQHNLRKQSTTLEKSRKEFWELEEKSYFSRKEPIEPELFLKTNSESLPKNSREFFQEKGKESLFLVQEKCFEVSALPMINLSDTLNSQVRLKYGAANLGLIQNYEINYNSYLTHLYKLGKGYSDMGLDNDAILFLEEAINLCSESSDHYILLGQLYKRTNDHKKLDALYQNAQGLNTITKNKVVSALDQLK